MIEGLSIRKALLSDFPAIFDLYCQLWPSQALDKLEIYGKFAERMESQDEFYFCAILNNRIVGYCHVSILNRFNHLDCWAYLNTIIIDEKFRSKGIGTALLEQCIQTARENGSLRLKLESGFHRDIAHHFYRKFGFKQSGMSFIKYL
jgi:ribosomal protein S18 acetylase RimI-like enzyme